LKTFIASQKTKLVLKEKIPGPPKAPRPLPPQKGYGSVITGAIMGITNQRS